MTSKLPEFDPQEWDEARQREQDRVEAVQAVVAAWTDEGYVPWYHRMMKEKLRSEWPALAEAIDNLVDCTDVR